MVGYGSNNSGMESEDKDWRAIAVNADFLNPMKMTLSRDCGIP
jgi:hypothetical protein